MPQPLTLSDLSIHADAPLLIVDVDEVLAHMDSWSAGRAVVLMGDTNLRPSEPPDAALLAVYADARRTGTARQP